MSTLANIRTKVRRLTGRPSAQQITDTQIDEYINTFYIYDFPETLRLFTEKTTLEILTTPNVDQYDLSTLTVTINGENIPIVNVYYNLEPPAYIAGYQSFWSQDNEQFFRIYPKLADITTTITGDGTPGPYAFTLTNIPVLQRSLTIGAVDDSDTTIKLIDIPAGRSTGTWLNSNTETAQTGTINYITGVGTVTFTNNIPSGNEITITSVPYAANRPQACLFYNNILTLRPVPDKVYPIIINAYKTPTAFLSTPNTQQPELRQWWQFLAFGAAKKIFEDVNDMDGVNGIMPGFKEQERLVLRRSIVQQTNQRSATIYTDQQNYFFGNFNSRF